MKKNFENVIEPVALDGENGAEQVVAASPGGPQYEALELGLKNFFGDGFDINDKLSQEVLLEHQALYLSFSNTKVYSKSKKKRALK